MNLATSVQRFAELWMLNSQARAERVLMVINVEKPLNVFMDESRQDRYGPAIYSVTAYLSTFDAWMDLHVEWEKTLNHWKVKCFHATDFLGRWGEFKNGWSDNERTEFITRLAYIASEHTTLGIGCAIRQDEYDRAIPASVQAYFGKDAYGFCLYTILVMLLNFEESSRARLPKPLYVLFDRKPEFQGTALRIYEDLKKSDSDPAGVIGDFGFGGKERYPQLQAADLLVYETTRGYIEQIRQEGWSHPVIDLLNRKHNLMIVKPTEALLQKYIEFLEEANAVKVR